jgi:hypothetical protein
MSFGWRDIFVPGAGATEKMLFPDEPETPQPPPDMDTLSGSAKSSSTKARRGSSIGNRTSEASTGLTANMSDSWRRNYLGGG